MSEKSVKQFRELLKEEMSKIDDTRLFYLLKAYKLRYRIDGMSFRILKTAIGLYELGLKRFTAGLLNFILDTDKGTWTTIHGLGDNHMLLKLRSDDITIGQWQLSELIIKEIPNIKK